MADKTTLDERIAELRAQAKSESGVGAKYGSPPMSEYLGLLAIAEAAEAYRLWVDEEPETGGALWEAQRTQRWRALVAVLSAFAKGGVR